LEGSEKLTVGDTLGPQPASQSPMPELRSLLGHTLVLVAHPDDEAGGCGVLLQRMRDPVVVFATDGAPQDDYFWRAYGSREAYAKIRRAEASEALAIVGVRRWEFLSTPGSGTQFVDQELFRSIPAALEALETTLDRHQPDALLTLAYEGGHPDHDTCNFLATVASRRRGLPVFEMALYHRTEDGLSVRQAFHMPNETEIMVAPTGEELERKRRMLAAYPSQKLALEFFTSEQEQFRPLVAYDYSRPPHPGVLNYEAWQWRMTGADLVRAFAPYIPAASPPLQRSSAGEKA
jgi:N-acetylglucosamine malate deacetylase 2